jgi:alkyl hydroperoxide reductase subunit AhpF
MQVVGTNGLKAGIQVWQNNINHRQSNFETLLLLLACAALYASRQGLKTLLITKDIGGEAVLSKLNQS